MKLTSILLVSAMLAMALTVAATPAPKDENSGSGEDDESLDIPKSVDSGSGDSGSGGDGSEQDNATKSLSSAMPIPTTPVSYEEVEERSKANTVDGDGEQFCDISKHYPPQCHTVYKCKAYKLRDDTAFPGLLGGTTVASKDELLGLVSEGLLGTCVGKMDANKD
ncbi:hypothetical protein BJ684DRAFT_21327 [Piptocephalis cylindrospora]|uniref:Uncharacterized protein n=1 Tax=Piptocephalis cylindrospora TaxID=1907219 RepID=A0A4P9Y2R4_9FUNG|nr:hypothetical protein BJ684DRAFT_21327 [Piptocephalis cylindrospora]|eukprot:RKP12110.1 hypothetical protein BJ684DRAFT_21327 [Piptocephalis cylindrospora]